MVMYDFLKTMWVESRVTEEQIRNYESKGFITQQEAEEILATPLNA